MTMTSQRQLQGNVDASHAVPGTSTWSLVVLDFCMASEFIVHKKFLIGTETQQVQAS